MAGAKEKRWFWAAEELFVIKGYSFDKIMEHIAGLGDSVSKGTLSKWAGKGDWHTKRKRYLRTGRGLAPELARRLEDKARRILADDGDLSLDNLKELNQMLKLIKGMGKDGPGLPEMAIEIMGRFAEFVRDNSEAPEDREIVTRFVSRFLGWIGGLA